MIARLICTFAVLILATVCAYEKTYDHYALLRLFPDTQAKVDYLNSLEASSSGLEIQIWQHGNLNMSFDLLVSPESTDEFTNILGEKQIKFEFLTSNIAEAIQKERKPQSLRNRAFSRINNPSYFNRYLQLDEMDTFMKYFAKTYPNIVTIEQVGWSYENRPINAIKVGSNTGKWKPAVWIDGGIHSREWIAVSTVAFMVNKLVTEYNSDPNVKNYVDKVNWYFVPVLNVDGYVHTHTKDRMWRKNRRAPSSANGCYGVDLNRNFDWSFGGAGTSSNSCEDTYRGPSAFSEPETKAVRDFILGRKQDMKAFMTIHAYSNLWFYPYGDARGNYPSDGAELEALAQKAAGALAAVHGTYYTVGTPADILYAAAGGSLDWAKGYAGVKFSYGMELRPGRNAWYDGFILPTSEIVPVGEETWAGISVVADEVIRLFAK